ncbi:urease accessory protein UreF [Paracoccus sp. SCSIO 75233]|uniref:urease accessory protein UreF n=1 Tax=Paracoccus sp. SCSIO 75233 TaxID=3017782 RepID=UPI0022F13B98|nr:urease accessory UreF family protein [Paracoccus sp. SCSIO 75233]WBU52402.1 urease accessory protein UreF [Paracoccus sp. SCSIO 75233]
MDMDGHSVIPTDAGRLLAVQLLSPVFPTGAFAYSQGLEYAMDSGIIRDGATLSAWIADVLEYGTGWSDAVILSLCLRPGADYPALDDLARAMCLTAERLTETVEQGTAFVAMAGPLTATEAAPAALPVAVGRACARLELPRREVIGLYLHGLAFNLIQAAVRFMPLGQAEGQRLLAALSPQILNIAAQAADATESNLGGCAIGAEIAQARHETMTTRIFRT